MTCSTSMEPSWSTSYSKQLINRIINTITLKPVYLEHVDNWFLKNILIEII